MPYLIYIPFSFVTHTCRISYTSMQHPDSVFADSLSPNLPKFAEEHRELLRNVRIVLVQPRRPGNIGSAARALTVCGFERLYLVDPVPWQEEAEAWSFAHGSHKVLANAIQVETFEEALEGVHTAIGTTHRTGRARGPMLDPRAMSRLLRPMLEEGEVAVVFGREDQGLFNEELAMCQMGVHIPTATKYPSLNLSHAIMVIAYELLMGVAADVRKGDDAPPGYGAVVALSERFANVVERAGLRHGRGHTGLVRSLRLAFGRDGLQKRDFALLHLLCKQFEKYMRDVENGGSGEKTENAGLE